MRINHVHLYVQELAEAIRWFEHIWQINANFMNERMAVFSFDQFSLILDTGLADTKATIGFQSDNCDRDYQKVVERGAITLEAPADRPWGVRVAYLKGPGALTIEIEQSR